ncbi:uncharacterized protein [Panulirus ornatus]|uniref:uncharacterized protein n=1 Tax=Panulirus ornatus TaxID=150431 RepID=UPI003A8544F8
MLVSRQDEVSTITLGAQSVEQHDPVPPMFKSRMMALPAFHDAFTLAASLYSATKDQQYVGVALKAAEVGVWAAANTALPLATPLVKLVGGWTTLEEWACRGLDRVEQAVPIITKPTVEIMATTRDLVLTTLAGEKASNPPPTVATALTTRASRTVACLAQSRGGRVAVVVTDRLLDTAHGLLDSYLPPSKGDLHDSDGRDGSLRVKAVALADKTCRRFKRTVYTQLNVNHNHVLDDDDIVITFGHLVELGRRSLFSWYFYISHQPYVSEVLRGVGVVGTLVVDGTEKVHIAVLGGVKVVYAHVTNGLGRVQAVATNSMVGSTLKGGVHKASGIVMDGVGVVNRVTVSGMILAHDALTKGTALVHITVSGGFDVGHKAMQSGMDMTQSLVRKALGTTHTMMTSGAHVAHTLVTNAIGMTHNLMSSGVNATKYVANFIPLTISSLTQRGYSHIHTNSPQMNAKNVCNTTSTAPECMQENAKNVCNTTNTALGCVQENAKNVCSTTNTAPECMHDTPDALVAQITSSLKSFSNLNSSSNSQVFGESVYCNSNADVCLNSED